MRYDYYRSIGNMQIIEAPDVPAGTIYVWPRLGIARVREAAHLSWQIQMAYLDEECKMRVEAMLAKFRESVGLRG